MAIKAKDYARYRDEQFSVFENYARKNSLNSKSMLVLMWIYYSQGAMTQDLIAKRTYSTKQVIQAIIKGFQNKELLYLEPSVADRRKKIIRLTERGQAYAAEILDPLRAAEDLAMSKLSEEQQVALLEATRVFSLELKNNLESSAGQLDD
ncbi:MarR family winged helix-turn-helix transcriptional regulator [Weissella soli]|uniref:MarR family winged helix-turn-helix transcriptional regulator n=1 Tax=Weissella soli TaxID=155866 RepID=UPI001F3D78E7|nr:MarR family winged helix-turn-helix transcriptional regulator [Weissella soli]GJM47847.1 transcriptional regulator [Weissella soli]